MIISELIEKLDSTAETVSFEEVTVAIDAGFDFTPTAFSNGGLRNAAGQNSGACKIFAFASLHGLSQAMTLNCFGDYYRKDALADREGGDHQNIRRFMVTGWRGIRFESAPGTILQN
jgi:hypothetical protein